MLIFCFAYMIEGASGFGTPVALSSPMLVSLGYPKFESVVTMLLMNTFATIYGAAGTQNTRRHMLSAMMIGICSQT